MVKPGLSDENGFARQSEPKKITDAGTMTTVASTFSKGDIESLAHYVAGP